MAPVGELELGADPTRWGCRCGGAITLAGSGEAVEREAVCCLPRGHDGGIHFCGRHDIARLAQARRGADAAEEAGAARTGVLGDALRVRGETLSEIEAQAERA
eukprot:175796-Alexandrium_andersonii.AAC.1